MSRTPSSDSVARETGVSLMKHLLRPIAEISRHRTQAPSSIQRSLWRNHSSTCGGSSTKVASITLRFAPALTRLLSAPAALQHRECANKNALTCTRLPRDGSKAGGKRDLQEIDENKILNPEELEHQCLLFFRDLGNLTLECIERITLCGVYLIEELVGRLLLFGGSFLCHFDQFGKFGLGKKDQKRSARRVFPDLL